MIVETDFDFIFRKIFQLVDLLLRGGVVDGKAQRSSMLTLSHWPWNATPPELMRDTSTDIVFAYLDAVEHHQNIELVSNSHFDEDGLLSMYALVDPENDLVGRGRQRTQGKQGQAAGNAKPRDFPASQRISILSS